MSEKFTLTPTLPFQTPPKAPPKGGFVARIGRPLVSEAPKPGPFNRFEGLEFEIINPIKLFAGEAKTKPLRQAQKYRLFNVIKSLESLQPGEEGERSSRITRCLEILNDIHHYRPNQDFPTFASYVQSVAKELGIAPEVINPAAHLSSHANEASSFKQPQRLLSEAVVQHMKRAIREAGYTVQLPHPPVAPDSPHKLLDYVNAHGGMAPYMVFLRALSQSFRDDMNNGAAQDLTRLPNLRALLTQVDVADTHYALAKTVHDEVIAAWKGHLKKHPQLSWERDGLPLFREKLKDLALQFAADLPAAVRAQANEFYALLDGEPALQNLEQFAKKLQMQALKFTVGDATQKKLLTRIEEAWQSDRAVIEKEKKHYDRLHARNEHASYLYPFTNPFAAKNQTMDLLYAACWAQQTTRVAEMVDNRKALLADPTMAFERTTIARGA